MNQGGTPSERVQLHLHCIKNHLAGILRELPTNNMIEKLKKLKDTKLAVWLWSMKNEIGIGAVLLYAFFKVGGWMRKIDPEAAPLDIGLLSIISLAVVGVIAAVILFWILWRFCFPDKIDDWFDSETGFLADFFNSPPAVRLACFFGTLWTVILGVGMIVMALR